MALICGEILKREVAHTDVAQTEDTHKEDTGWFCGIGWLFGFAQLWDQSLHSWLGGRSDLLFNVSVHLIHRVARYPVLLRISASIASSCDYSRYGVLPAMW